MSPPSMASPQNMRSVTDPNKVPQVKDLPQTTGNNDVMQDLLNRLSMSQKKPTAATPPRPDTQASSGSGPHNETPSPFHDGRSGVRSVSGPSTPAAAPPENPDFFYGNRNLSPLFKAAQGEPSKRNSGLRTEITADSPMVAQGMFQDFPSVSSPRAMDPNTFSRSHQAAPVGVPNVPNAPNVPAGPRRGSVPYNQPYREAPNNPRRTPGRQNNGPRPSSYHARHNNAAPPNQPHKAGANGAPASVKKPATSMMSFVPASVAAKKHSSSAPPAAGAPPVNSSTPESLALEQDLKRMLNLKMTDDASGVRL